ncbi:ribonuclease R, partial [Enterococcus faecium]|nr:ribonuclease R [Enterococcus faecium]
MFHANDRGFGFVSVEEDEIPDIYISEDHTAYALNMDEVDVKITRPSKKGDDRGPEGIVKKITSRHFTQAVGVFEFAPEPEKNVLGHINLKDKKMSSYQFDVLEGGI